MRKGALIATITLLVACGKDIQNKDAVRTSIVDYLTSNQAQIGLNMDSMQLEVTSLQFSPNGKEAQAIVAFKAKAGGDAMKFPYTLDRKGNAWVVRPHSSSGENPHPPTMPPLPSLPPNHPPVDQRDKP